MIHHFKHATISLYVLNTTTGKTVTETNTEVGVAPASCQKVITAVHGLLYVGARITNIKQRSVTQEHSKRSFKRKSYFKR